MSSQSDPVPRPWRRCLRFSVRGLIVFVIVIGAGLGWIVREAHIQHDAVAAIKKAGGSIQYDWEFIDGKSIRGGKPWAPRWLVNLIGVDYFGHVTSVKLDLLSPAPATDATLAQIGRLTRLQELDVASWSVSDAGLAHLKGLTELNLLGLYDTRVTDAGLAHLKELKNLSFLWLTSTKVSDAGLAHLKGLNNLSTLWLNCTEVTDAGLVHLKGLTKLSRLELPSTKVSDAGLAHLEGLTKLGSLDLRGTQVTDAGMNELKRALPGLWIRH